MQARFAGLVSYGLSADLLNEILPLGRASSCFGYVQDLSGLDRDKTRLTGNGPGSRVCRCSSLTVTGNQPVTRRTHPSAAVRVCQV